MSGAAVGAGDAVGIGETVGTTVGELVGIAVDGTVGNGVGLGLATGVGSGGLGVSAWVTAVGVGAVVAACADASELARAAVTTNASPKSVRAPRPADCRSITPISLPHWPGTSAYAGNV